jgi:hypothetical protein
MRNYALDTSLLPQVWITWATTKNKEFDKRYWVNCQTNTKKDTPESWMIYNNERDMVGHRYSRNENYFNATWSGMKKGRVWIAANSKFRCAYIKYHPDIDRLEMASVGLDTTRNGDHKWTYLGDRCFVGKDKSVINEKGETLTKFYLDDQYYYTVTVFKHFIGALLSRNINPDWALTEFKKLIGSPYFRIGNGTSVHIRYPYEILKWYTSVQKQRATNKAQKQIDDLTAKELGDSEYLGVKYPAITIKDKYGYNDIVSNIVYFEPLDDDWGVLRLFYRNNETELCEQQRIYIGSDGKTLITSKNQDGHWISSQQHRGRYNENWYLANADDAIAKCPRIKYILMAAGDKVEIADTVDLLVTALRFPELEQLIKLGGLRMAKRIANNRNTKAEFKEEFGGYFNEKSTNLLRKVGLNKKQLDAYLRFREGEDRWYSTNALELMRKLFGNDLSPMDIESFEIYFHACYDICSLGGWHKSLKKFLLETESPVSTFKNLVRLSKKEPRIYSIVQDTMDAVSELPVGSIDTHNWVFDDVSDVIRLHDAAIELKRIRDAERQAMYNAELAERRKREEKKRIELDKERKKYEYEDDNYIIRLPLNSEEIIREGSMQHICIGGYTTRHAMGDTNLFFLRKKSDADMPFYAIEMSGSKAIKQIHGFGNCWLGNNPEAIPTVIRWLRKNGIICSKEILTCTSHGYCSTNSYVDMPVVDGKKGV